MVQGWGGTRSKKIRERMIEASGAYRKCEVRIGLNGGVLASRIPKYMKDFCIRLGEMEDVLEEEVWNAHHEFETMHPFIDWNGRTGRLLLNWLSLRHLGEFTIVDPEKRQEYYKRIEEFKERYRTNNPKIEFYSPIRELTMQMFLHHELDGGDIK